MRLQLSANVSNAPDLKTAAARIFRENQTDLPITPEAYRDPNLPKVNVADVLSGPGILRDPRFLVDSGFQGPRSFRLGVKLTF